jgi:hypothetical protein
MKIEGLPVIEVDESEEITVAVRADDLLKGDAADPERHPIAMRRQDAIAEDTDGRNYSYPTPVGFLMESKIQTYQDNATQCEARAQEMPPELRRDLLILADNWRKLASKAAAAEPSDARN